METSGIIELPPPLRPYLSRLSRGGEGRHVYECFNIFHGAQHGLAKLCFLCSSSPPRPVSPVHFKWHLIPPRPLSLPSGGADPRTSALAVAISQEMISVALIQDSCKPLGRGGPVLCTDVRKKNDNTYGNMWYRVFGFPLQD